MSAARREEVIKVSYDPSRQANVGTRRRVQLAQAIRQQESVTLQRGTVSAAPAGNGTLTVIMNGGATSVTIPCYRHVFATAVQVGDTVDILVSNNGMRVIGITGIGPTPSGRLYSTSQTVLATATPSGIAGLSIDFVAGGMIGFGGSALQVPTTGRYYWTGSVYWQSSNAPVPGGIYTLWLYVNGANRRAWTDDHPAAIIDYHGAAGSDIVTLNANDYVQMIAQQESGANAGTTFAGGNGGTTAMSLFLVATQ